MTIRSILPALGLALIALPALAQQSQEEIRFQPELKACEAQPETAAQGLHRRGAGEDQGGLAGPDRGTVAPPPAT